MLDSGTFFHERIPCRFEQKWPGPLSSVTFILLVLLAAHRLLLGKASTRRFLLLQAQGWTLSGSLVAQSSVVCAGNMETVLPASRSAAAGSRGLGGSDG